MKALIVFAHPSTTSFNFALKDSLKAGLIEAGYEVLETDLYRLKFKAPLNRYDYPSYDEEVFNIDRAQIKACEDKVYDREIQDEMDKVLSVDIIIFQFPFWKLTCPAIMTGWLQRTFPMGFGWPEPVLRGKKIMLSFTCGETQEYYNSGSKTIADYTYHIKTPLERIGLVSLPYHTVYNANGLTPEEREAEKERIREIGRNINNS